MWHRFHFLSIFVRCFFWLYLVIIIFHLNQQLFSLFFTENVVTRFLVNLFFIGFVSVVIFLTMTWFQRVFDKFLIPYNQRVSTPSDLHQFLRRLVPKLLFLNFFFTWNYSSFYSNIYFGLIEMTKLSLFIEKMSMQLFRFANPFVAVCCLCWRIQINPFWILDIILSTWYFSVVKFWNSIDSWPVTCDILRLVTFWKLK